MPSEAHVTIRTDLARGIDLLAALLFTQFARTYWRENLYELEPPRRPPSWYPGQPEPQKPRKRACTCMYALVFNVEGTIRGPREWSRGGDPYVRCFVIVFDCPHHGDDLLDIEAELDDLYPDGGVWGFTIEDC